MYGDDGIFVKSEEAVKYYENVKKIIGSTDMGPYYQKIGFFSDGKPVPTTFEEFSTENKDEDLLDLKEAALDGENQ